MAYGLGNLLDLCILRDRMNPQFRRTVETYLHNYPDNDNTCFPESQTQLIQVYYGFKEDGLAFRKKNTMAYQVLGTNADTGKTIRSILQHWKADCTQWLLLQSGPLLKLTRWHTCIRKHRFLRLNFIILTPASIIKAKIKTLINILCELENCISIGFTS